MSRDPNKKREAPDDPECTVAMAPEAIRAAHFEMQKRLGVFSEPVQQHPRAYRAQQKKERLAEIKRERCGCGAKMPCFRHKDWEEVEAACDDCGPHPGLKCPACDEIVDLVMNPTIIHECDHSHIKPGLYWVEYAGEETIARFCDRGVWYFIGGDMGLGFGEAYGQNAVTILSGPLEQPE